MPPTFSRQTTGPAFANVDSPRFEVLGLDADRKLIGSLAQRLAQDDPEARRICSEVTRTFSRILPKKGGILAVLRRSPLVGVELEIDHAFDASRRRSGARFWSSRRGKKRRQLEEWFQGPEGPQALFRGRVMPFDETASLIWARLMSEGAVAGRRRSAFDMVTAATDEANDCIVVTDNEKHFSGIRFPIRSVVRDAEARVSIEVLIHQFPSVKATPQAIAGCLVAGRGDHDGSYTHRNPHFCEPR